ncbi:MAG: hypothetical protein N2258_08460 [Brevinematales bacterium]|nr:hypothetical protein [Brevinematales bacterium]
MKMNYIELPKKQNRRKNPLDDYVFASRVRLSRNIDGLKFSFFLDENSAVELEEKVVEELRKNQEDMEFVRIGELTKPEILVYIANRVLTTDFLRNGRIFGYKKNGDIIILFNEEDHLKVFSIENGFNISSMFHRLVKFLESIESNIDFAYDEEFGYLTSSIFNVGTALKISVLVNLSGIMFAGKIGEVRESLKEISYSLQPFLSSNIPLFFISNTYSLGLSEEEMVEEFEETLIKIIRLEKECREKFIFFNQVELRKIFDKILGLKRLEKIDYNNFVEYVTLVDLLNKQAYYVDDINYMKNLVFIGCDDYLKYKTGIKDSDFDSFRIYLLKKLINLVRFKKAFI